MTTEKRLIDANKLIAALEPLEATGGHEYYRRGAEMVLHEFMPKLIAEQPTVDAVEVVRCKDCKWRNTLRCPYMHLDAVDRDDLDYCSDGERRNDGPA